MDGKPNGKDDSDDTSRRGSFATHPISAEGPHTFANNELSRLGCPVLVVATSKGGDSVMAASPDVQERPSDKEDPIDKSSDHHSHRQLGDRLGSLITNDEHIRVLDERRTRHVNQCKRDDGHIFLR